jgi:hypothetical protein
LCLDNLHNGSSANQQTSLSFFLFFHKLGIG